MSENRSWLFELPNKIDKFVPRLIGIMKRHRFPMSRVREIASL